MPTGEQWRDREWRAAQLKCDGHQAEYRGVGMSDQFVCTCGWESNPYWDGDVWAEQEAQQHIALMRQA